MLWYKISLSKKDVARGKISEIQHIFFDYLLSIYAEINTSELAMLADSTDFSDYKIYLSPKCSTIPTLKVLLDAYSAEQYELPSTGNIAFLAGDIKFAKPFIRYQR